MNIREIQARVHAGIERVWSFYTSPEHIVHWNFASEDWHCSFAENDLAVGGKYLARMEVKDKSMGFDFEAMYLAVEAYKYLEYKMPDNRKVEIYFDAIGEATEVKIRFEAECSTPIELQRQGWQAILDNFKAYTQADV